MRIVALAAMLAVATPAFAGSHAVIKDTSFRDARGGRVQQLELSIDVPIAKIWKAFTTDSGFMSWAAPLAHIDLRNGGMIEASYRLSAKIGDPENIRNRIVAYLPERLLVLHNVHAPKNGPFKQDVIGKIRTIFQFEDLGHGRTRVVESGVGYGEGSDFDTMYRHFRAGNRAEFILLVRRFETGPIDWKAEAARANASVRDSKKSD
jgi:uncharacterized protein YndB with AHSA1/START domain